MMWVAIDGLKNDCVHSRLLEAMWHAHPPPRALNPRLVILDRGEFSFHLGISIFEFEETTLSCLNQTGEGFSSNSIIRLRAAATTAAAAPAAAAAAAPRNHCFCVPFPRFSQLSPTFSKFVPTFSNVFPTSSFLVQYEEKLSPV